MLYNPEWDKATLLDRWINWLETKDPAERYEWTLADECACGQFYGGKGWQGEKGFNLLNSIAQGGGHRTNNEWTFGKCLARAKHHRDWQQRGWFTS